MTIQDYIYHDLYTALNQWKSNPLTKSVVVNESISDTGTLFLDSVGSPVNILITENTVGGPVKFRGKFQEANTQNKNKREYPFDVLDKNVKRLMETVKVRGLIGELDHPCDSVIHFEKASHVITDLWWEGNVLMGEGEILPTPHGKILENLIKSGIQVGISSRGVGNGQTRPSDGVLVIGESYKLITFDAVADPSTFSAFQKMVTKSNSKQESTSKNPIITDTEPTIDKKYNKNESISINKLCSDKAFVAYVGQVINNYKEIKKDIFK